MPNVDRRGRDLAAPFICLVSAAVALLICSMNSWLYALNSWSDVNCFVTVARGWLHGLLPYRDLAEQKGPLLYALHALAMAASPHSYHGIWFVELAALTAALILCLKIARLYRPETGAAWVAPLAAAVCASFAFQMGDSAEELCWPFVLGSVYGALKSLRLGRPVPPRGYILHGFLAGCVLWIKFNQLGPHLAFMAFLAISAVIEDKGIVRAAKMCLLFLAGMALASLPWMAYFAANGALGDLLGMYFYDNIFGYTVRREGGLLWSARMLLEAMWENKPLTLVLGAGGLYMLPLPKARMGWKEKIYLLLTAVITALAVFGGGRKYNYYYLAFAPLAALALIPAGDAQAWVFKRYPPRRAVCAALCALLILLSAGAAWLRSPNRSKMSVRYEDTPQGVIGAAILSSGENTLLSLGNLDNGFYLAADALPVNRYFCRLNNSLAESLLDQLEVVRGERVRFLVMREYTLDDLAPYGEMIGVKVDFTPNYHLVLDAGQFHLYERNEGADEGPAREE